MTSNPKYIRRFFTGRPKKLIWTFSSGLNYATIDGYEHFLFVKKSVADGEEFKQHSSIKGTKLLVEHSMDDKVKQFLTDNYYKNNHYPQPPNLDEYRVYTFFKKFGKGGGSMENDCLRFAESLAIGKYPYRGGRSFMKDNITENLLGESYERNFQISNEIKSLLTNNVGYSPYNNSIITQNINEGANPDIGECYGMLSLWSPKDDDEDEQMPYHFACVLFKDFNIQTDATTNITVEANVGDQSMEMPNFHLYNVGDANDDNRNYPFLPFSFHFRWVDSFETTVEPIFSIKRNISDPDASGLVVATRTPAPITSNDPANSKRDKWGFLTINGEHELITHRDNDKVKPITIVGVLKEKVINKKIIPKAFLPYSATPNSPTPSPIRLPNKMHTLVSPSRVTRRHRISRPPSAAATLARRRVAATQGRQNARSRARTQRRNP